MKTKLEKIKEEELALLEEEEGDDLIKKATFERVFFCKQLPVRYYLYEWCRILEEEEEEERYHYY